MAKKYAYKPSKSRYLKELTSTTKYASPLKRSLSGYEMEFTLIDEKGDISNNSDMIIDECRKLDRKFPVKEEVAKHMLEIVSLPHTRIQKTALYLIDNIEKVINVCSKQNLYLLPLATYPGRFKPQLRKNKRYTYSARATEKSKYNYFFPRCFGFHYHYTLPRGVFNKKNKFLNEQFYSKIKTTLLDSYNFLISADPVLTTFTQSSPFEGGKYYAKDTRMLYWRGGKRLKFNGMFSSLQLLGGLPPYKQTLSDLINTLNKKDARFRKLLKKTGASEEFIKKKKKLDFIWNPVKVNKLGTLEQRGMDMNHLNICLSISVMAKFILRAIQQEFYHVIPSDIGLEEPFKLEGNAIFIPPHTHVRNKLQYESAYNGLSSKYIYKYCTRFYSLARKLIYKEYIPTLRPIKRMLDKKATVSDQMIRYVKNKGYSTEHALPQEICRDIALHHANKMFNVIERVKKRYEGLD